MRILQVISSVDPRYGGPIEWVRQLAAAHARAGHVTEVLSADDPSGPAIAGCPLPLHALGPPATRYSYSARVLPWLRTHSADYDAVIVNGLWQYTSYAAWRALRGAQTPYFVFPHGMLDPWFKRTYPAKHLKKWLFWPWADYRLLRDARAVLFTCEEERLLARQSFWLYRCNERVVNLGTAPPPGDADRQRDAFLARFPELRGRRLLLFLSRIHEKKGCDLLIEAYAKVAAGDHDLHLVMAGPDQAGWRASLEARCRALGIASRVTWTGMLNGELKWGAYRAADAFVLPSHQENFGIVVAEALACGLPVLISDKVNIWREVALDRAGLVGCDTEQGTVDMLKQWLALTPAQRTQMARDARHCYAERFDIDRAAANIEAALTAAARPSAYRMEAA